MQRGLHQPCPVLPIKFRYPQKTLNTLKEKKHHGTYVNNTEIMR